MRPGIPLSGASPRVTLKHREYDGEMATHPERHPLDDEIAEIYAANPELKAELDEMEEQLERGELELADDTEARRIARPPDQGR
jgi:hypothetical protein